MGKPKRGGNAAAGSSSVNSAAAAAAAAGGGGGGGDTIGNDPGIAREDKLVDEDYGAANGPWSPSVEVHFFDAIEYYPPAGAHVYLNILSIRSYLKRATGIEFTPQQILDRVAHYWNVEGPGVLTLSDVKSQYELYLEDGAGEDDEDDEDEGDEETKVDYSTVWSRSFALPKEFEKLANERHGAEASSPECSPMTSSSSSSLSSSSSSAPSTKRRKT